MISRHPHTNRPTARFVRPTRPGSAYVLTLLMLAVMTVLATAMVSSGFLSLRKADNLTAADQARLAAESGLSFITWTLNRFRLPGDTTQATFLDRLRDALGEKLDGTDTLAGQAVVVVNSAVFVPEAALNDGRSFCCWITWVDATRCRLTVKGSARGVSRHILMDFALTPKMAEAFEYGLASRGQLRFAGHARVLGVNDPTEANVFSGTLSVPDAIHIEGSAVAISGDLSVAQGVGSVVIEGSPQIGGTSDPAQMTDHIHFGVEPPDFPQVQTDPFAALATHVVNSSTNTSASGQTFSNIRIAAGTNPVFASNVTVNGVVYVESPNVVSFEGGATINGMIVTQDNDDPIEACQINFAGNVNALGVEGLPDTPEFAAVKQHTGTFLLAPGFGVTFAGDFETIAGAVAADQFTFTGSATGVIKGSVVGLDDRPSIIDGNIAIYVDRSDQQQNPAGFVQSIALVPRAGSYAELVGAVD